MYGTMLSLIAYSYCIVLSLIACSYYCIVLTELRVLVPTQSNSILYLHVITYYVLLVLICTEDERLSDDAYGFHDHSHERWSHTLPVAT
jgi:hypothetical protein